MRRRAIVLTAVAIVGGALLALLGPASPAVGYFSPPLLLEVEVHPTATLVAKGAAVEIRVDVTCAGTSRAELYVEITQRSGSEIATGRNYTTVGCTGGEQSMIMLVTAFSGRAFKSGSAVVTARLFGCAFGCGEDVETTSIRITH